MVEVAAMVEVVPIVAITPTRVTAVTPIRVPRQSPGVGPLLPRAPHHSKTPFKRSSFRSSAIWVPLGLSRPSARAGEADATGVVAVVGDSARLTGTVNS